jgi:tetratricopeptide (TPR) repeat protein
VGKPTTCLAPETARPSIGEFAGHHGRPCLAMKAPAVLIVIVALSSGALAQGRPPREEAARSHFLEGQAAYQAGNFPAAADAFAAAYRLQPSPEIAFNIARVHERMGDLDLALRYYDLYLRRGQLAEADAASVRATIDRLRAEKARRSQTVQPAPASAGELNAEARTFFERGIKMFRRHDYTGAYEAFQAALSFARQAHAAVPELFFNMATTLERLGRNAEAAGFYDNYLRAHHDLSDRERDEIHRKIERLCAGAPHCP